MNTLPSRDMRQHVMILGWLYLVSHALFLVVGLFLFVLLTGIGVASDDPQARSILGIVGTALGLFLAALSVPGLAAGYGLLQRTAWAPTLALVVGILGMVNIPVGTAIGAYTLWALTQPETSEYFRAAHPA